MKSMYYVVVVLQQAVLEFLHEVLFPIFVLFFALRMYAFIRFIYV